MIRKDCPLSNKDKLYVTLHGECRMHVHPNCLEGCSLFKKRRLTVTWTNEILQDLKACHNVGLEEELIKMITAEVEREIGCGK